MVGGYLGGVQGWGGGGGWISKYTLRSASVHLASSNPMLESWIIFSRFSGMVAGSALDACLAVHSRAVVTYNLGCVSKEPRYAFVRVVRDLCEERKIPCDFLYIASLPLHLVGYQALLRTTTLEWKAELCVNSWPLPIDPTDEESRGNSIRLISQ